MTTFKPIHGTHLGHLVQGKGLEAIADKRASITWYGHEGRRPFLISNPVQLRHAIVVHATKKIHADAIFEW